jgi:hypothetical protein
VESFNDGYRKAFDLNIEKILEDWEIYHALREVIANAIDEQFLTNTAEMQIKKGSGNNWIIRDFGRGLKYEHLTQKENIEKQTNPNVIGKFGIGLKDALATFDRHGVNVSIKSKYGDITLGKSTKHGFNDIKTLHAYISKPSDPTFVGTEFTFIGIKDTDIEKAKDLFLKFSGEKAIEKTKFGEILKKKLLSGRIYINGVKVAEEENFLFSYNITSLNEAIKKALNRESTNVGRTAYSDRVRAILISSGSKQIAHDLADDLKNFDSGEMHDELKWLDVQEHAVKILNSLEKVVFLTPEEMSNESMMLDEAKNAGYTIISIPSNLKFRIKGQTDVNGKPIRDLSQFSFEYSESFEFKFINSTQLNNEEKKVFAFTEEILKLVGGKPKAVTEIKISETMKKQLGSFTEAAGVWERQSGRIIIKRSTLSSTEIYAGTLLHEIAHAQSGADDVNREFENQLTHIIGLVSSKALKENVDNSKM